MKARVKSIRKELKITQADFANALNISKSTIEKYENGRLIPTDRTISDICRIYAINETWLRTGEGEMFAPKSREAEIAEITTGLMKDDEEFKLKLIKYVANMSQDQIEQLKNLAKELLEE